MGPESFLGAGLQIQCDSQSHRQVLGELGEEQAADNRANPPCPCKRPIFLGLGLALLQQVLIPSTTYPCTSFPRCPIQSGDPRGCLRAGFARCSGEPQGLGDTGLGLALRRRESCRQKGREFIANRTKGLSFSPCVSAQL